MSKVELLAPAGNKESFYGAICAGADAVYLAGKEYGARAYADNFSHEDIIECLNYAHLLDKKIYLTVNTLMKSNEISNLVDFISPLYLAGLDGVIIQDIGALSVLRNHFPNLELHASTQMTICDEFGAKQLMDMGICRIVPARELSLQEIKNIKDKTGIEIETFIHGAMCYCYSGQCLFSSILGGRSGNRGRCAQPCRLPYKVSLQNKNLDFAYPLSLKDMCTIENIPQLIDAGINSFKIEGRMKKPEYASGVTAIYRKYIDLYYSGNEYKIDKKDLEDLSNLYIRSEISNGYYFRHNGSEMISLGSPAYSKTDEKLLSKIKEKYLSSKVRIPISIYAEFSTGLPSSITLVKENTHIVVKGNIVQKASNRPITSENIAKQLSKLGDTAFVADHISVKVSDDAFYQLGAINELRRSAIYELEKELLKCNRTAVNNIVKAKTNDNISVMEYKNLLDGNANLFDNKYSVLVSRLEQLSAVSNYIINIDTLYIESDILKQNDIKTILDSLSKQCNLVLVLPYILRKDDHKYLYSLYSDYIDNTIFDGVMVRSIDEIGFIRSNAYPGKIYLDSNVYTWNNETISEWGKYDIKNFTLPLELNSKEYSKLNLNGQDKIVYGRIPMMITANCVAKTSDKCVKGTGCKTVKLCDRYNTGFPVSLNCEHCYNIIYNSVPISLHKSVDKLKDLYRMRLNFTIESFEETKNIMEYYINNLFNSKLEPPIVNYTTGHEKRGVE